jgi:hypothetical protein
MNKIFNRERVFVMGLIAIMAMLAAVPELNLALKSGFLVIAALLAGTLAFEITRDQRQQARIPVKPKQDLPDFSGHASQ